MENELVKNMIKRENLVPGWNQKGTRLEKLDWPQKQTVKKDFLENVPGHPLKGTGQLHKKIRYLISILSLTAEPLSLEDIMKAIGYANKKTFRDNYIKPLEQLQFITKTDLVNLSSPDQKYKLTKAGALFLGNQS
jgi:ATP-dependent DNA helicase RecG